jgi:hypothetical protein
VIDSKGVLVGNVKDVSIDFPNRSLAFVVVAKNGSELDVAWEDVISLKDVVLLKNEITIPTREAVATSQPSPGVQAVILCANCGTSVPAQAKFCPKCGRNLK